jgi:hypothetical protein
MANDPGMKPVLLGELFDRPIFSVAETIHPSMPANDGLDQALVAHDLPQKAEICSSHTFASVDDTHLARTFLTLRHFVSPRRMIAQAMRASLTRRVKSMDVMNSSGISKINPLLSS